MTTDGRRLYWLNIQTGEEQPREGKFLEVCDCVRRVRNCVLRSDTAAESCTVPSAELC